MKNLFLAVFISFFFAHVGYSDTYVWEDYDDFSGSSLDTSKWEVGYFSGGQAANVTGGIATLSGSGFTGSDLENVPFIWQSAAAQSVGQSNSGIFVKQSDVFGIELELSIPNSGNSQNVGFIVETHAEDGSVYNGIELAWRENGLFWSFENEIPSTLDVYEVSQSASFDQKYTLSVVHTGSRMELHIDGNRVANLNSSFAPYHWLIGSFNDDGQTFTVPIDNVRVLKRSTSETLDGTTLFLDSDDPVTLNLFFDGGTMTSTFEDGGEDSGTESGIQYDYFVNNQDVFSIVMTPQLDGDLITFDRSNGRGKLFDFQSNGQLDESGTWEFSFTESHDPNVGNAPSTLTGLRISIDDPAVDRYFTDQDMFGYDNNVWSRFPYTYQKIGSDQGELTIQLSGEAQKSYSLSFTSTTEASGSWTRSDDNSSGTTSLITNTDLKRASALSGTYYGGSSESIFFNDSTHATIHFPFHPDTNGPLTENISYTYEIFGDSVAKLSTSTGDDTWMFFDLETNGTFDLEGEDYYGAFSLNSYEVEYPSGYAKDEITGDVISIGATQYLFHSDKTATVYHEDGSTSTSSYTFFRSDDNEAIFKIDDATELNLTFLDFDYGRITDGGYFQYLANYASKGWVWYDKLPWIYSNNQGGWMSQYLSINSDTSEVELNYFEKWSGAWKISNDLNYTDQRVFSSGPEYYWEDYDDFNGTELNASKWGTMYFYGGDKPVISSGQVKFSSSGKSNSASSEFKQGWDSSAFIDYTEEAPGSVLYVKDESIYGIEALITLPSGSPAKTAICLQVGSLNPYGQHIAELMNDTGNGPSFWIHDYVADTGISTESSNENTFKVSVINDNHKNIFYVNDTKVHELDASNFTPDWFGINTFENNGQAYNVYADNVRVYRKKNHPVGWMWTDYYPWAYSHETGNWVYFELAKDSLGDPVMNYWDSETEQWDIYEPALAPLLQP